MNFQNVIVYCYKFKSFNFKYESPLLYMIQQNLLENIIMKILFLIKLLLIL